MVKFLECDNSALEESYNLKFKTANTVSLTASCWYEVLFTYLSHRSPRFLVCPLQEKVPKVPGRAFPMVDHPFVIEDKYVRWTRVIIIEVMDLGDPQRSWDVKNSDVYEEIRDMDPAHPERKSFGALSAGTKFILFEVTGKKDPVYLLGSPEKPANFVEDAESLENVMRRIYQVAIARECKCPDSEITSRAGTSVDGKAAVIAKVAPPHIAKSTSSTSSATASPVASAKTAPAASTSTPIGHTADPKPVVPVTGTKPAATSNSRSSSPARAGGNGLKATSANK